MVCSSGILTRKSWRPNVQHQIHSERQSLQEETKVGKGKVPGWERTPRTVRSVLGVFFLTLLSVAWAAGDAPAYFSEVATLIVASALIAYGCFRLGLVPIVGFLIAGVLLNLTGLVTDMELIDAVAEIGVILLLFTIGIEFSLDNLMRIQRLIFVGGGLQVGVTIALVTGLGLLFGVDARAAVFTGMLLALSSTAIVMKLLANRGETNEPPGRVSLGILIFQDLAVVGMVILVPILGGAGASLGDVVISLGSAALIIAAILLLARRVMPRVLEALARTCSQEIFLLGVIAVCFGTAYLTGLAGVSLSLGAFLAGLLVSESRFGSQALGEILPLQILFSAAFFVSIGLLLDVGFLLQNLPLVLLVVAGVLVLKAGITTLSARALGYPLGTALAAGLILAQVGEFSFVLERAGREVGLFPAGLAETGGQTFIAATVLLMGVTPFLAGLGSTLGRRLGTLEAPVSSQKTETPGANQNAEDRELDDHVIIAGYGAGGKKLAHALKREKVPFLIVTLSPTGAAEAEKDGLGAMRGDYATRFILEEAGILNARMLAILDDAPEHAARVIELVRGVREDLPILARTQFYPDALELKRAGATVVTSEEVESVVPLLSTLLDAYGTKRGSEAARALLLEVIPNVSTETLELKPEERRSDACTHQERTKVVTPEADVCLECVAQGDTWVHLRVCMTCGHVGCCDSSKNKHATAHFEAVEHPIIKSLEKGETWSYCYVDEATL